MPKFGENTPNAPRSGRPKGIRNRVGDELRRKILKKYKTSPLEYVMRELHDPTTSKERKDELAIAIMPFFHPKVVEPTPVTKAPTNVGAGVTTTAIKSLKDRIDGLAKSLGAGPTVGAADGTGAGKSIN